METIKLIGIDPGTNYVGLGIYTLKLPDLKIIKIENKLIDISNISETKIGMDNIYKKLTILRKRVIEIIEGMEDLKFVAMENSFINRLRPQAFGPLTKSIIFIEDAVHTTNEEIKLFKFPPSFIKISVNASFKANKLSMTEALKQLEEVKNFIEPDKYTEHENDGIAIGYTLLKILREKKDMMCLV